jgi:hypothetical protein
MVFKKKSRSRRVSKRVVRSPVPFKRAKRSSKRSLVSNNLTSQVIGGMSYGALRSFASQLAQPLTDKLGFAGVYADNVVMAGLSYALAKGKVPVISGMKYSRDIGKAGLSIESAFAGVDLKNQLMGSTGTISSTIDNRF